MPAVSVIIPTHNRIEQVVHAVNSVLSQSFTAFELIVVDDGSTDGTAEKLQTQFGSDIRLLRQNQAGVSSARNNGVGQSSGQFLAFLDSDDIWQKDKLKRQIEFHKQNLQLRISQTEETWIRRGKFVNPHKKHEKPAGYIFPESLHLCTISPSSVLMEKTLFDATGGFDEKLKACEDYDLWLRITSTNQVGLLKEKLLTKFGGHPDQLSQKFPAMDRFRLYSLCKVFLSGILNDTQQEQVRQVSFEKLKILSTGAEKRGQSALPLENLIHSVFHRDISQAQFIPVAEEQLLSDDLYQHPPTHIRKGE